jgi:WD40 repeat protein
MIRAVVVIVICIAPLRAADPLREGAVVRLEKLRSALTADQITFTPDSKSVVAVSKGRAYVWDAATGSVRRDFPIPGEQILILAPLPDGSVFTLDVHGTAQRHDLKSGERIAIHDLGRQLKAYPQFAVGLLGWRLDAAGRSALLFVRDFPRGRVDDQSTRLFRLDLYGLEPKLLREAAGVYLIHGISPDGRWCLRTDERANLNDIVQLYQGSTGVRVFVGAVDSGRSLFDLWAGSAPLVAKGFSADGQTVLASTGSYAAAAEEPFTVYLWETRSGQVRHSFRLPRAKKEPYLAYTPDTRRMIADLRDDRLRILDARTGSELGQVVMPGNGQVVLEYRVLAVSPDGKAVVSWHGDGSLLVWDLSRFALPSGRPLDQAALQARWAALADADTRTAHAAVADLIAAGASAAEFLAVRLKPAVPPRVESVREWIAALDDERFTRRRAAEQALQQHLELVREELRTTAKAATSAERRKRLESLVNKGPLVATDREELRELRSVEVLEHIGTAEARRALESLTTGLAAARLTREASAALERLANKR